VYLFFVTLVYVMHLTNSPTCFAILQEAVTKLMERVYPISAGTHRPLSGVLLKCLAVLCLQHDSIIEVVRGASGQGFIPGYNSLFRLPLEYEARTVGYGFCTDEAFNNDVVTGIPPHMDQLVSIDRLLKEQQSLGGLVKTEHTCLLGSIGGALDEQVSGNGTLSNQVCTLLSEFTSTMIDRLGERGGLVGRGGGGGEEVEIRYEKRDGYVRYCAQLGPYVHVPMSWCFPKGSLQVTFKIWFLPDIIFKVLPIRLLNVLDVKHLERGKVRLHEYGKLMDDMLQHVDVVAMGSRPSDSVVSFWSAQASAAVFDLVRSSYGVSIRRKKKLESLSWITLYKMMVEKNKYEEKLMLFKNGIAKTSWWFRTSSCVTFYASLQSCPPPK
jgi:hypothetical protein